MPSFFLGAGASKAFGYPTTKDFKIILAETLDDKFESESNLPENEKILFTTLKHKTYPDIEYVLEFWKRMLELKNKEEYSVLSDFFNTNIFGTEFQSIYKTRHSQGANLKLFFDYAEPLIDYLTNFIYSTYSSRPENIEKSKIIYSALLTLVNNNRIDIFTTNYDSVIEQYCKNSDLSLIDGFKYDELSEFRKWNRSLFDGKAQDRKCIFLCYVA